MAYAAGNMKTEVLTEKRLRSANFSVEKLASKENVEITQLIGKSY